jgi:cell division septal protein FtsQ
MDIKRRVSRGASAKAGGWRARRPVHGRVDKIKSNRKILSLREIVAIRVGSPRLWASKLWAIAKRLRRAATATAIVAVAAVVMWLGYRFLTTSERFAISTIEIAGASKVTRAEILAALPVHVGQNIFKANVSSAEPALSALPWVATVDVSRHLPTTIRVKITERQAIAIALLGDLYLIDGDGQPFKRIDLAVDDIAGLPVISGISRQSFVTAPTMSAHQLQRATQLVSQWKQNPSRPAVSEINIDNDAYTLRTDTAPHSTIHLGASDDLAARMRTFDTAWAALSETEKHKVRELRLDYQPDHITVAFAKDEKDTTNGQD